MIESRLYLDHNASSPLLPEARDAIVSALGDHGNASSVHGEGRRVRAIVEAARADVADLAGASEGVVVFTSGATEAASTCLTPYWTRNGNDVEFVRLAVLDTDHPCVRTGGRFATEQLTRLPVSAAGILDLDKLDEWIGAGPGGLLALCVANSETGVLQPMDDIFDRCRDSGIAVVCDCAQLAGREPIDLLAKGADAVILSAHKAGGPQGIGAFVLRSEGFRPAPLLTGGAQETRQRAGTEAVALIAGFGAAARSAMQGLAARERMHSLRDHLERRVLELSPDFLVAGGDAPRLPQTTMIHHPALRAETIQIAMDLAGFAVSAGSACSSGKVGGSHVLEAMAGAGAPIDAGKGAVRVSFGSSTTTGDLDRFLEAFATFCSRANIRSRERQVA